MTDVKEKVKKNFEKVFDVEFEESLEVGKSESPKASECESQEEIMEIK